MINVIVTGRTFSLSVHITGSDSDGTLNILCVRPSDGVYLVVITMLYEFIFYYFLFTGNIFQFILPGQKCSQNVRLMAKSFQQCPPGQGLG